MKYTNIREEALKIKVGQDFFCSFDCTEIIKDIDFAVKTKARGLNPLSSEIDFYDNYLLWA
jgi:hypothetical protein